MDDAEGWGGPVVPAGSGRAYALGMHGLVCARAQHAEAAPGSPRSALVENGPSSPRPTQWAGKLSSGTLEMDLDSPSPPTKKGRTD